MPVQITSRLLLVRTESGKLRLEYGDLDIRGRTDFVRLVTINGPSMVEPPAEEMTDEEFKRWRLNLVTDSGFSLVAKATPLTAGRGT